MQGRRSAVVAALTLALCLNLQWLSQGGLLHPAFPSVGGGPACVERGLVLGA